MHIPDVLEDPDYARPEAQKLMNLRAALGVPLLRDGRVFGVVNLFRTTPRPFTQKQIELVETFADQAVIAIENARLFEAEQQRTSELRESLDRAHGDGGHSQGHRQFADRRAAGVRCHCAKRDASVVRPSRRRSRASLATRFNWRR